MPFATSLFEQGTVVGPSAVACSNAASRSAGRIGAVQCLLLAELQRRVVGRRPSLLQHKCVHAVGVAAAALQAPLALECLTAASAYAL